MATGEKAAGRLGRHAALPRGRAVVGGLLIAASALGVFVAHDAATNTDQHRWLVATSDIAMGDRIEAGDLGLAPMQLAQDTAARAFDDGDDVVGRVASQAIGVGELVQRSAVGRTDAGGGIARRLAIPLPLPRALGGDLRSGDHVDVVAASRDAAAVIARHAMVAGVASAGSGLGGSDAAMVTLVVDDEATAAQVLAASARDEVALIAAAKAP